MIARNLLALALSSPLLLAAPSLAAPLTDASWPVEGTASRSRPHSVMALGASLEHVRDDALSLIHDSAAVPGALSKARVHVLHVHDVTRASRRQPEHRTAFDVSHGAAGSNAEARAVLDWVPAPARDNYVAAVQSGQTANAGGAPPIPEPAAAVVFGLGASIAVALRLGRSR